MILEINLMNLCPSPLNPRREEPVDIEELGASIKAQGLIEPLVVRPHPEQEGKYELVAGHRRCEALRWIGSLSAPCLVRQLSDEDLVETALVENHQRVAVNPMDEAEAIGWLVEHGRPEGELCRRLGVSPGWVQLRLSLTGLPEAGKEALRGGRWTLGAAAAVACVDAGVREQACQQVLAGLWDDQPMGAVEARDFVEREYLAPRRREDALKKLLPEMWRRHPGARVLMEGSWPDHLDSPSSAIAEEHLVAERRGEGWTWGRLAEAHEARPVVLLVVRGEELPKLGDEVLAVDTRALIDAEAARVEAGEAHVLAVSRTGAWVREESGPEAEPAEGGERFRGEWAGQLVLLKNREEGGVPWAVRVTRPDGEDAVILGEEGESVGEVLCRAAEGLEEVAG